MTDKKTNGHYLLKGYIENSIEIPKDNKTKAITVIAAMAAALSSDGYDPFAENLKNIMSQNNINEKELATKALAKQSFDHVKKNRNTYLSKKYPNDVFAQTEIPELLQTYNNPGIIDQSAHQIKDADQAREFLTEAVFETISDQLSTLKSEKEKGNEYLKSSMPISDIDDIISVLTNDPEYLGWQKKEKLKEMNLPQGQATERLPMDITFVSMVISQPSHDERSVGSNSSGNISGASTDIIPLHRNRINRNRHGSPVMVSNNSTDNTSGQRAALLRRDSQTDGSLSIS